MAGVPELSPAARAAIEQLEGTGLAAELVDAEWRSVWLSPELRVVVGEASDEELGMGLHYLESRTLPIWRQLVTEDAERAWMRAFGPFMAHETPGGIDALREIVDEVRAPVLDEIEPCAPPLVFTTSFEIAQGDLPPATVSYVMVRLHDEDGAVAGSLLLYTSPLPASVLALVARGDEEMFARMAELVHPERRAAAILFADLEASGALSRRLPSAAYFRLLSQIVTAVDAEVGKNRGLVGKHAGDGVTAFFLVDQTGSESAAARAAIETGQAVSRAAGEVADRLAADDVPVEASDCRLNVGLHWGGALYMGQVVTGGRLEVTALGDEVNEGARIEQTACEGRILASKAVIERLSEEDAADLGIDPDRIAYRPLGELEGAAEKTVRDAGTLAVAELG